VNANKCSVSILAARLDTDIKGRSTKAKAVANFADMDGRPQDTGSLKVANL
jgi:hypothetical protein